MKRILVAICALCLMLTAVGSGQTEGGYLDVMVFKVKPEKRADLDGVMKKMVDANRANKGDSWIVSETYYGEGNTIYITSLRENHGEIETGMNAFMGAITKAAGPAGAGKLFQDFSNCIISGRGEIRRRRFDLSSLTAADPAAAARAIGQMRWTRTTEVRVRPGRTGSYEDLLKSFKGAWDRNQLQRFVAQSSSGQQGQVYYITTLAKSMSDFDAAMPVRQLLGETTYQNVYLKTVADATLASQTYINKVLPELSNPPAAVAAAAPDFWHPKPPAPEPAKTKKK